MTLPPQPRKASAPQQILVPQFQNFANLSGGINLAQPADQLAPNQSPDMQNLIYRNGVLQVDTGYVSFGNRVVGTPLQPIQFELTTGTLITCLVTTSAFYTYDTSIEDWVLAQSIILSTTWGDCTTGSAWACSFSTAFGPVSSLVPSTTLASVDGIAVGDIIQVALEGGGFYTSTIATIDGSVVTMADPLLPGQQIPAGAAVEVFAPLNGGKYPISWTVDPTTNTLIWTNGVDPVQAYGGSGSCAPLDGLSEIADTALLVARYYGFTLAIGTTESGTELPYRVRRSTNVSSTDWTSEIAGYDDLIDTADAITSVAFLGGSIILGRQQSIMTGVYWGTIGQPFFWQYTVTGIGVLEGKAIAQSLQTSVLISQSGVYNYTGGYTVQDFGDPIFNYTFGSQGNLNPNSDGNLFVQYVAEVDEIWFFYPSSNATYCDTLLRWSNKYGGWFPRLLSIQVTGVGFAYSSNARLWDEIVGDWLVQTGPWVSRATQGNYPLLLIASALDRQVYAYDYTSQSDNGIEIAWYFTSKDFPVLNEKLLFDGIVAYGRGNAVLCEVSTDYGATWATIGTFNFGTSYSKQTLDYQVTGDFFRFRMSGVGYGFFLSQFSLRYLTASEF